MLSSIVAPQAKGKKQVDVIFGTNALAVADAKKIGKDKVINATIGAILDEEGNHVFLKTVENVFRNLPAAQYSQYAPIAGLPEYIECVETQCFGNHRPSGYIKTMGIAGGTGGLHHLVHNYTEKGDEVLTADWFWGAYAVICSDNERKLVTYEMLKDAEHFNHEAFREAVNRLAKKQKNILIIINTPAHNPTGYTVSEEDWDEILNFLKTIALPERTHIILGVDVAYLDYAGESDEVRRIFEKFGNLPEAILTTVIYSLSKSYTLYGQRVGGLIAISSNEQIIDEFFYTNQFTSRSTWSNLCRPAMHTMVAISKDPVLQEAYENERAGYYHMIKERAGIFMKEAVGCGLPVVPYHAGFFISIPSPDPTVVCDLLHEDHIYLVPLKKGIRIALCGISQKQVTGLAEKVANAMKRVGQL